MSLLINNVKCDAFAHIDKRTVSDTVKRSVSRWVSMPPSSSETGEKVLPYNSLTVFLFCDDKAFPVSDALTAECCIKGKEQKTTVSCDIGSSGEIIVIIPHIFRVENERLSCEINICGTDKCGHEFRYKAASFIVAIVK